MSDPEEVIAQAKSVNIHIPTRFPAVRPRYRVRYNPWRCICAIPAGMLIVGLAIAAYNYSR